MAGLNIENLKNRETGYRPDRAPTPDGVKPFETLQEAKSEERKRWSGVNTALRTHLRNRRNIRAARQLRAKLDGSGDWQSMASPV